ncbi:MAG: hypothetical protein WAM79_12065 [Candidatus Sulfotelmatobacter sp.]
MARMFALLSAFVSLVLIAVLTISCGGSSNSKIQQGCTGGPYNVVGDWQITVSDNGAGSLSGYGAIDSAGLALFFDNSQATESTGDTVQLPTITGACSFTGDLTAYAEPGGLASGSMITDSALGNVTSATAINGTFTGSGSNPSGTFTLAPLAALTGSASAITGDRTGAVQGALNGQPVLLPVSFSPTGTNASMSFTSTVVGLCGATGSFTQVNTANVFDVSITLSGSGCGITGTFTGLGFESSTDYFNVNGNNPDTYLYADILASTNTFVIEFF